MSNGITPVGGSRVPPSAPAGPAQAPQAPVQAQPAAAATGLLGPRTTRAQEQVNHRLRAAIRSAHDPGIPLARAEANVRAAMAQGAEPSRSSRSVFRTLLQSEGHGNTALHHLARHGTPAMSAAVIREPLVRGASLDANATSRGLAPGVTRTATPLHLAVEAFNGAVLRDLLLIPGADVHRRYLNPIRAAHLGGRDRADMTVVEIAQFLARRPQGLNAAQRQGLVAVLQALVEHGERHGYSVDCGPFADEVAQLAQLPAYTVGEASPAYEGAPATQAGPSSRPSLPPPQAPGAARDEDLGAMGTGLVRRPPRQGAAQGAGAASTVQGAGAGSGTTPLHQALESFDGDAVRAMLARPGVDVHQRNPNPCQAELRRGSPRRANMTVVETAEFLAMHAALPPWKPEQREGLITALRALVDHGRQNGYRVNCSPFGSAVEQWTPPPDDGDPAGDTAASSASTEPAAHDDDPRIGQAGPSSRP